MQPAQMQDERVQCDRAVSKEFSFTAAGNWNV